MDLLGNDVVPEIGRKEAIQGQDGNGRIVSFIHKDTPSRSARLQVYEDYPFRVPRLCNRTGLLAKVFRGGYRHVIRSSSKGVASVRPNNLFQHDDGNELWASSCLIVRQGFR